MTLTEFFLKAAGKFKPIRRVFQSVCRYVVAKPALRKRLNSLYLTFNYKERLIFHFLFSSIFRNRVAPSINDVWKIRFNNKIVNLPLRTETLWLDWDLAVSIVGHDVEIKSFYEEFLRKTDNKLTFLDVGANYGTHSLLFLTQGVQVITFEPNPDCEPVFRRFLELNKVNGRLENFAIGDQQSVAELVFPKADTWNGSLQENYQEELSGTNDLTSIKVQVKPLDEYVFSHNIKPDIIKIDTEGYELNVLKGARKLLKEFHPIVVFESNKVKEREGLFRELLDAGYNIYDIDHFYLNKQRLSDSSFIHSSQVNFVAEKEKSQVAFAV